MDSSLDLADLEDKESSSTARYVTDRSIKWRDHDVWLRRKCFFDPVPGN